MAALKRYVVAGAAFVAALSAGYVMQNGLGTSPAAQLTAAQVLPAVPEVETLAEATPTDPVVLSQIAHVSALPEEGLARDAAPYQIALAEEPAQPMPALASPAGDLMQPVPATGTPTRTADSPRSDAGTPVCDVTLRAEQRAAAMVHLVLEAPCLPNDRVTIHHSGLMFTLATDDAGRLEADAPALTATAVYMAAFDAGAAAVATLEVDSLDFYDRAVVQWQGDSGLHMHALEYGAHYGDAGHVWAEAPRDLAVAARGEGGFMTLLGDPALPDARLAEVYTFPTATAARLGDIDLSVEASVTPANCGKELDAQSLQVHEGAAPVVQDLVLGMPDCSAAGDYLLLKNLVNDLKIARN